MKDLTEQIFEYHFAVVIYWTRGIFSKTKHACKKKTIRLALEYIKTVNLECRLLLSVVRLIDQILVQNLTAYDRQFLQGNLFLLAVCMQKVPLYLCSICCSCSLVQLSTTGLSHLECGTHPKLYPVTLNITDL